MGRSNEILAANVSWNGVQTLQVLWKSRKGYAPVGRLYSTFWSNLSKKISFGGVLYPYRCTDGVKVGKEEGTFPRQISPNRCNMSPLRGEKSSKSDSE